MFSLSPRRFYFLLLAPTLLTLTISAYAQNSTVTLTGHVAYSTGQPAAGANVTLTKNVYIVNPNEISHDQTAADSSGGFSFQVEARCGVEYDVQANSPEMVDGEPLPPSGVNSTGGCVLGNTDLGTLTIARPQQITLGGIVRDQFGTPVEDLTITMTRTKYDVNPNVVTTANTTTDGNGHYQFSTYSRCSVVEEFKASIGSYTFPEGTSISGCVNGGTDNLNFTINQGMSENGGPGSCNRRIGRPVNVSNGNVYLSQSDYQLPGAGEPINIVRSYNSISQVAGLFGRGWRNVYDETINIANGLLQLTMADGRVVSAITPDFFGQIVQNGDGTYTVTFKDGRVHQFNALGQLTALIDRNGNQTNLAYDGSGKLTSIIDPSGRALTIATDANGHILSLSDSVGTIATYSYGGSEELLTVVYADNSGYHFSYASVPGGLALSSITDVLATSLSITSMTLRVVP